VQVSGLGLKAPDFCGAWACYKCHEYVDTHKDADTVAAFAHGMVRTQNLILKYHKDILIEYLNQLSARV
jgi:hypothetical protein